MKEDIESGLDSVTDSLTDSVTEIKINYVDKRSKETSKLLRQTQDLVDQIISSNIDNWLSECISDKPELECEVDFVFDFVCGVELIELAKDDKSFEEPSYALNLFQDDEDAEVTYYEFLCNVPYMKALFNDDSVNQSSNLEEILKTAVIHYIEKKHQKEEN